MATGIRSTEGVPTNVRRGDTVVVVAGKEKGKRGRVLRLLSKKHRVVVERVAMIKRHTRATQANPKGGIIEKEGSLELSNVALWCGKCNAGRRVKIKIEQTASGDKAKQRVCAKCSTVFEAA